MSAPTGTTPPGETADRHRRVLVLGSGGQLGHELMRAAWPAGTAVNGLPRAALDIRDEAAVAAAIAEARADLVVCAAAYTAVDRAESETEAAFAINRDAAGGVARAAARHGAALIHVSTDYIFDGTAPRAYREADPINPLSAYGRSKAEGEAAIRAALPRHVILRTSWVFGARGQNFVKTMLRLAGERPELRIVDDQHGCPTAAADLARVIVAVAAHVARDPALWGTYHYASAGVTSWAGFAEAIFEIAGRRLARRPRITRIGTAEYPVPARRPANSELDCSLIEARFGIARIPWRDGLAAMLDEHLGSGSVPARTMAEAARS